MQSGRVHIPRLFLLPGSRPTGIILMGVVVTFLVAAIQWLQKKLVKWNYT
jgi:hypothetical protein